MKRPTSLVLIILFVLSFFVARSFAVKTTETPFVLDPSAADMSAVYDSYLQFNKPIHMHGEIRTGMGDQIIVGAIVTVWIVEYPDGHPKIYVRHETRSDEGGRFKVVLERAPRPSRVFLNIRDYGRLDIPGKAVGMQLWDPTEFIKSEIAKGEKELIFICTYPNEVRSSTSGFTMEGQWRMTPAENGTE